MTAAADGAGDWGLYVNECGILATRAGLDRWTSFLARAEASRLTMLWTGPGGGKWHVMCGTREAAQEAQETFTEAGFHRGHVKAARLSACQAKAGERRQQLAADRAAAGAELAAGAGEREAWAWFANNVLPDPFTDPGAWQRAVRAVNAAPGGAGAEALRLYREHLAREAAS